uniref:Uncharacterized protein n=1 Tax=Triticum urartu TaxID=4572 RepID=A0A8R7PS16_TRIUA
MVHIVQRSSSNSSTSRIRGEAAWAGSQEEQQHGRGRRSSSSSTGRSPLASSWSTGLWRQAPAMPVGDRGGAHAGAPGGCAGARGWTHTSLRRMRRGSRREARGLEEDVA